MPNEDKRKGPPEDVAAHLLDVLTENGAIEHVADSKLGEYIIEPPAAPQEIGFVSGWTEANGYEAWSWDGTTLTMLGDVFEGQFGSSPYGFTIFNGAVYFAAYDPGSGVELREYDGSDLTVFDVNLTGDSAAGFYGGFVEFQDDLYFNAFDPDHGYELRKLDGTTGEVSLVEIVPGWESSLAGAFGGFTEFNGELYFTAYDPTNGYELRKYDGSSLSVIDIDPSGDSMAGLFGGFTEFNGNLYFTAFDAQHGDELRMLDGTTGEVSLVKDISEGSESSLAGQFGGFAEFNGDLYFTASDADHGDELWKLDGETGQVSLAADVNEGDVGSSAGQHGGFVEFNGDLYFSAFDAANGQELRKLDGETGSVSLVEISEGGSSSFAGQFGGFTVLDGDLYFTARDAENGYELRKLDGDTGLVDTFDFLQGSGSSFAEVLGTVNGHLVIAADMDLDGDGIMDRRAMLDSDGEPTSVADFTLVDDGSGTFEAGGPLITFEVEPLLS